MSEDMYGAMMDGFFDDPFSLQVTVSALKDLSEICGESGVELFSSSELLSLAAQVMRDDSFNPEEVR